MPAVAIRRLLEATEAEPDEYALIGDADLSATGAHTIFRSIIWNRPELLLPCGDCHVRGEYVGLMERETCPTCGGKETCAGVTLGLWPFRVARCFLISAAFNLDRWTKVIQAAALEHAMT